MQSGSKIVSIFKQLSGNLRSQPLYSEANYHFLRDAVADIYGPHSRQYVKSENW
ncbi:MAG: hypothetical protein SAJ12_19615 [Jaaginema sp. PMC 1079.18]|nr:hypothetical protein [Jaaginema sp. PMC 1080.18]MEC4853196.1 hypothetical protein [Jaaginema sp. PMC 1079.18]